MVLPTNQNATKHTVEPFTHAPYIHPFNVVKYSAQVLRYVNYAKATNQRLLWVLAQGEDRISAEDLDEMRQVLLKSHD